jgi:iron complex transport system substrate-binding protein
VDARRSRNPWAAARTSAVARLAISTLLLASLLAACGAPAGTSSPGLTATAATPTSSAPASTASPTVDPSPAAGFPATIVDDEGTEVAIGSEPQRIVSLTPAATEILFALGIGDRLVGKVEDFALYPPEAADVPDVAGFGTVDVEAIVASGADLVIAGGSNFNPPEAIARLRSLGIPTLVIFAPDLETALADIALIGRATGQDDAAAEIVGGIEEAFDAVADATADLPKPRVFYELDASNGYFGPAPDYFGTEMIRIAGGDPLTSGTPGVYQIQPESIVAFDPEVILLGDAAYGVTPEQVAARPGWDAIAAVRTGDVRPIDDVIVTRPGPRLADGIRALALAIHPDLVLP